MPLKSKLGPQDRHGSPDSIGAQKARLAGIGRDRFRLIASIGFVKAKIGRSVDVLRRDQPGNGRLPPLTLGASAVKWQPLACGRRPNPNQIGCGNR